MPDLPFPGYPPPGTSLADIVANYPWSLSVGLYTNPVTDCPPPGYDALTQPNFPGYQETALANLARIEVPPGSNLTGRRFAARFHLDPTMSPVTCIGWFAFARLNTGDRIVVLVRPFPGPLVLAPPMVSVVLQPDLAVNPGGGLGGMDVLASSTLTAVSEGGRMANVFRGEQRAALRSLKAILAKITAWDLNIGNLPPRSKLSRQPIVEGVPTTLVFNPGPPPVYYPGDACVRSVQVSVITDLGLQAPITPP